MNPRSYWIRGGILMLAALGLALIPFVAADAETPSVQAHAQLHRTFTDASAQSLEIQPQPTFTAGMQVYSTAAFEPPEGAEEGGRFAFGPGSFASGFEPPCSTTLNGNGYIGGGGSGAPQNCDWHTSTAAQPGYSQPHIDDVDPATDLQHLRFQYDIAQPTGQPDVTADPGSRNWAFSDDITPTPAEGVVHLSMNVKVSGIASPGDNQNSYIIQPQAPTQGLLTTYFILNEGGTISVADDNANCDDEFLQIIDTGVPWIIDGDYHNVHICVDTVNDRVRYFYDGQFVYSTGQGEGGIGGPGGCGVFAGSIIEHVLIRYEANANDGSFLDVDDVEIAEGGCLEPTGACCVAGAPDTCSNIGLDSCADAGGVFAGVGTSCTEPVGTLCDLAFACDGAMGGCFEANGSPGCDDLGCCVDVCQGDDFCCTVDWDGACVEAAEASGACLPPSICPECSGDCLDNTSCQQLSVNNASNSTTDQFTVADGFTPAADGVVNSICWNGAYIPSVIITDDFTITYYDCDEVNNPGVPNAIIGGPFSQSGGTLIHDPTTEKIDTGLLVAGQAPIYEYHASHADVPVMAGQRYFVEIVNAADPSEAWFWELSVDQDGDGESFQRPFDFETYERWQRQTTDVAFCLNIELADQSSICQLPPPQPCELDTAGADIEENESCGADPDLNLACSADPAEGFTDLGVPSTDPAMPTLVHGEAWAEIDGTPTADRDIDWYRFTAPSGVDANNDGEVFACVALASELPMQGVVGELSGGECPATLFTLDVVSLNCEPTLAVGYALVDQSTNAILFRTADAGEELFDGYPCGGGSCPADCGDMDGNVGIEDLLALLAQWGVGGASCDIIDNGDPVGIEELLALLAAWGPCEGGGGLFGNDYLFEIAIVDTFEECFPEP